MESCDKRDLESELAARCGRIARLTCRQDGALGVVLEPTGDRGRVDLVATGAGLRWAVTDRGAMVALYGLDLDFVVEKLSGLGTPVSRWGDELVARTSDLSLAEAVAEFADSLEFVPVLAGLFANGPVAA